MARGRKPTATAIKESKGSFKKNPQRFNENEPEPELVAPPIPDILQTEPEAVKKWGELCANLEQLGLLASTDADLMGSYCLTWATFVRMQKDVWEEGVVVGNRTNPKQYEVNKSLDRLFKLGAEFGLSPSSRTRLSAKPKKEVDAISEFFKDLGAKNS